MRGQNFSASDDSTIAMLSSALLVIGIFIVAIAVWKYTRAEMENAIVIGAVAVVIVTMALAVLMK